MNSFLPLLAVLATLVVSASATTPRPEAHLDPKDIPGLEFQPNFQQYSGYITLTNTTKNIFYWFVESQNDPGSDPVVLWLQGGPGCSGLGGGFFEENGPYFTAAVNASSFQVGLVSSFYSWNRIANVIYIESPCGVGFSYGGSIGDYENNDNQTAIDNYVFLQEFFQIYPEFAKNDFWITGESYGGIYIPTLAYQILTNSSSPQLKDNLERGGLMLGNPVTGCDGAKFGGEDDILFLNTQVNLFYWHALTSRVYYDEWNNNGCSTSNPPNFATCVSIHHKITAGTGGFDQPLKKRLDEMTLNMVNEQKKQRIMEMIDERSQLFDSSSEFKVPSGKINPDALYYSFCTGNVTLQFNTELIPNCFNADNQILFYLNNKAVQKAIHAKSSIWRSCGGVIYTSNAGNMMPYLDYFFANAPSMRILYYSGDIDIDTVPFAGTQRCLQTLNRTVESEWAPWVIENEIAGYVEIFDTYTYTTLKGAGHEAPAYQPASAYLLYSSFMNNIPLPKPN